MRKTLLVACALLALCGGCTRSVDVNSANATLVPGTSSLYRFCDAANLIYFSKVDGDSDQFEFFIPGGCEPTAAPSSTVVPGVNGGGR